MNSKLGLILLGLGWVLLTIFLLSGYYFNKFNGEQNGYALKPISWESHIQMFEGALQCNLTSDEILERKIFLKQSIFPKVTKKEEIENGYVYYFNDDNVLLDNILEFMQKEKECCPFFKFDISVLPFEKGIAFQISGSEGAFELLEGFEKNDF